MKNQKEVSSKTSQRSEFLLTNQDEKSYKDTLMAQKKM